MKLTIQISFSKFLSQLFCVYLTLVGFHEFGQPIFSSAATIASTSSPATTAPYVRKSRDTGGLSPTSAPEGVDAQEQYMGSPSNSGFFPYPSFKHKYQTRMTRFHGGDYPSSNTHSIRTITSFPKLNPLAGLLGGKSNELISNMGTGRGHAVEDMLEDESQDPTFTPFISARALSNIPQFFQHLRANLEALQLDDENENEDGDSMRNDGYLGQSADGLAGLYGNDDEGRSLNIPIPSGHKPMRWMPPTAGMTGRAHIRHFVHDPAEPDLFYRKPANNNPSRNAYEFGLG